MCASMHKTKLKINFFRKLFLGTLYAYGNICFHGLDKTILDNLLLERITNDDDWLNGQMICFSE